MGIKTPPPKSKSQIAPLQGLRAIAAMSVVLFHINGLLDLKLQHSSFFGSFKFGYLGVDLFFVLSGFIIYYTYSNVSSVSIYKYFYHRFTRIFPIYWLAFGLTLTMYFVMKYVFHFSMEGYVDTAITTGGISYLIKCFLLIPTVNPLLTVSWTLSFEILFYFVFIIYFCKPNLFFSVFLLWIFLCYSYKDEFIFLNPIIMEFLYGCIIATLYLNYGSYFSKLSLLVGVSLFSATIFLSRDPSFHREVLFGVPAAFTVYGLLSLKHCPSLLTKLGDASYSIYLFHFPLLGLMMKFLHFQAHTNVIGVILFLSAVSISYVIHVKLEKPLLNFMRRIDLTAELAKPAFKGVS